MKTSIRTKFSIGVVFLFLIILVLSVFSAFYLNKLSNKTSAILKENYLSVVYAREMSESLMNINREITNSFLMNRFSDTILINKELTLINNSVQLVKSNITEPGEDMLVSDIINDYTEYRETVSKILDSPESPVSVLNLQNKSDKLYKQLALLSNMNGKAIEIKTDDAKLSSKTALTQMSILGTICFLIALSFTYNFASYFNKRIFQLYTGIKEIVSSNYDQRLYFEEKDEFFEISLVFNEMAEKLRNNKQEMSVTLHEDKEKDVNMNDLKELKSFLLLLNSEAERALEIISRLEKK